MLILISLEETILLLSKALKNHVCFEYIKDFHVTEKNEALENLGPVFQVFNDGLLLIGSSSH